MGEENVIISKKKFFPIDQLIIFGPDEFNWFLGGKKFKENRYVLIRTHWPRSCIIYSISFTYIWFLYG